MSFYLNIECSKDIDYLEINFSDGTSTVQTAQTNKTVQNNQSKKSKRKHDIPLDLEQDYEVPQEIVEKPEIPEPKRQAKVANELQNFDI